jgi:hypothetical protein
MAAMTESTYFAKVERFEQLYDDRVATAVRFLAGDAEAVKAIETARSVIKSALQELLVLYQSQYGEAGSTPNKDDVLRLTHLEANIAMTSQQTLEAMQKLIRLQPKHSPKFLKSALRRVSLHSIRKISASLARRDDATPLALSVGLKEMLCAGRKPVKTAVTVIGLVGLHRPISDWPKVLDPTSFFRFGDIEFQGVDEALVRTVDHPRRVLVVIGNHDTSLYDGAIADRLARQLGSKHHIRMIRKTVYPIPPSESARDVVFVDEYDPNSLPVAESVALTKESLQKHDVVSISIFPEGMLPFAGAQMPLVTKDGAFLVARKLAVELAKENVPVFLVETKTNTLVHLTQPDVTEATVRISSLEQVPFEPMIKGQRDQWIASRRLAAENRFNADRGEKMVDILRAIRVPHSLTFEARGLSSEHVPAN